MTDLKSSINPFLSVGSFNTQVEGVRVDAGKLDQYGGTTAYLSGKTLSSDGYLTNAGLDRQNLFAKIVQPQGENTTLIFATNLTRLHQNVSIGATRAQIAPFGSNHGLSADPNQHILHLLQTENRHHRSSTHPAGTTRIKHICG